MIHHFSHHFHLQNKNAELNKVYWAMSLKTFAFSVIAIFIPIYLYKLNYSFRDILFYYALQCFLCAVGEYFSGLLVAKVGSKKILATSFPLMALSLFFLLTLNVYRWPLWFLAVTASIPLPLFWVPYHNNFSKATDKKKAGRQIGKIGILVASLGALGPLLGGVVAEVFGMQFTITISILTLIVAIPFVFRGQEILEKRPMKMSNFSFKKNLRDMGAYAGYGVEAASTSVIWPLFVFLVVGNYKEVGFISTAALLLAIATMIFVGKITDKYERGKVLKFGSYFNFIADAGRVIATTVGGAYLTTTMSTISGVFMQIPFISKYYVRADEEPRMEYIVGMEIFVDAMTSFLFVVLIFASYFLNIKEVLLLGIVIGALGSLPCIFIGGKKSLSVKRNQEEPVRVSI